MRRQASLPSSSAAALPCFALCGAPRRALVYSAACRRLRRLPLFWCFARAQASLDAEVSGKPRYLARDGDALIAAVVQRALKVSLGRRLRLTTCFCWHGWPVASVRQRAAACAAMIPRLRKLLLARAYPPRLSAPPDSSVWPLCVSGGAADLSGQSCARGCGKARDPRPTFAHLAGLAAGHGGIDAGARPLGSAAHCPSRHAFAHTSRCRSLPQALDAAGDFGELCRAAEASAPPKARRCASNAGNRAAAAGVAQLAVRCLLCDEPAPCAVR